MISGSCLCKRVRFEIRGTFGPTSHCHCSMCRKVTGAAFGTFAELREESYKVVSGAELILRYRSSLRVERTFCARCGSTLQYISEQNPGRVEVALGTLDDDPGVRATRHIFVASKAPWFEITDGLPQHAEGPLRKS